MEFRSRLVKQEWCEIFERGLDLEEYGPVITDGSSGHISKLNLDARFARHPLEEMAAEGGYVLLREKVEG